MDWLATKQATKRPRTAVRYESHLRLHVLPAFGPTPVAAITRRDVQQWINTLTRDNLSASTFTAACSSPYSTKRSWTVGWRSHPATASSCRSR